MRPHRLELELPPGQWSVNLTLNCEPSSWRGQGLVGWGGRCTGRPPGARTVSRTCAFLGEGQGHAPVPRKGPLEEGPLLFPGLRCPHLCPHPHVTPGLCGRVMCAHRQTNEPCACFSRIGASKPAQLLLERLHFPDARSGEAWTPPGTAVCDDPGPAGGVPARAQLAPRARRVPTTQVRCRECDCTRRGAGPLPALLSAGPGFLLVSTKHWLALSWPRGGLGAPIEDRARLPEARNLVQAGATDPSPEMRLDEAGAAAPWDLRPVAVGVEHPGGRSPLAPELYLGPSKPSLGDARSGLLPGDRLQTPGLPQGTSPALSLHRPSDLRAHEGQGSPELGGGTD